MRPVRLNEWLAHCFCRLIHSQATSSLLLLLTMMGSSIKPHGVVFRLNWSSRCRLGRGWKNGSLTLSARISLTLVSLLGPWREKCMAAAILMPRRFPRRFSDDMSYRCPAAALSLSPNGLSRCGQNKEGKLTRKTLVVMSNAGNR